MSDDDLARNVVEALRVIERMAVTLASNIGEPEGVKAAEDGLRDGVGELMRIRERITARLEHH